MGTNSRRHTAHLHTSFFVPMPRAFPTPRPAQATGQPFRGGIQKGRRCEAERRTAIVRTKGEAEAAKKRGRSQEDGKKRNAGQSRSLGPAAWPGSVHPIRPEMGHSQMARDMARRTDWPSSPRSSSGPSATICSATDPSWPFLEPSRRRSRATCDRGIVTPLFRPPFSVPLCAT